MNKYTTEIDTDLRNNLKFRLIETDSGRHYENNIENGIAGWNGTC